MPAVIVRLSMRLLWSVLGGLYDSLSAVKSEATVLAVVAGRAHPRTDEACHPGEHVLDAGGLPVGRQSSLTFRMVHGEQLPILSFDVIDVDAWAMEHFIVLKCTLVVSDPNQKNHNEAHFLPWTVVADVHIVQSDILQTLRRVHLVLYHGLDVAEFRRIWRFYIQIVNLILVGISINQLYFEVVQMLELRQFEFTQIQVIMLVLLGEQNASEGLQQMTVESVRIRLTSERLGH